MNFTISKADRTLPTLIALLISITLLPLKLNASEIPVKTYKIVTDIQADGTAGKLISEFAKNVQKRTNDKVRFKIFHAGVLGDQLQYFQHIQRGVIDIGLINSASIESVIPYLGIMNMPYLFRSAEEYRKVMNSAKIRDILFESAKKNRFAFLGYLSSDFRSIYTSKPVTNRLELASLRLRTISSQTYMQMLHRFGAVPTALPFGELYSAMQQGVVDGAEGGIAGIYEAGFSDVAKFVLHTEHTRLTDFVIASTKFTNSLSETERQIVNEEFIHISDKSIDFAQENERITKKKLIDEKGVKFYSVDKEDFINSVKPLYEAALAEPEKATLLKAILQLEQRTL
ncbi:TRAP transporter substrate-binding protein DctP [Colwellia sp. 20A7]|jgi:TRAP-type C4-dicarboxylate transport system substrate-binding protein|uniref:TRAP transporter substrate-binding protein DctP n=1 Tax=Colwellia sp. 20A7 TaxID=2689569 RepID=UPI00135B8421|nr:TRAP transporter substrate-binding protein DctP [Colwellia sp. 20A7]